MGALAETRELSTDAVKEAYLYDALGRLVSRTGSSGDAEVFVYDGLHMVQSYDATAVLSWAASWGPGVDRLLSVEKQGTEYFALDDGKGSVVAWLDSVSNTVPARAEYTPEGRGKYFNEAAGTDCTESGNRRCGNHLGLPFGFHSAFVAKQSGLLYFRNRWYSTEANQWLSQDPLDFVDSFDLYSFNAFDAINHRDPLGLAAKGATTEGEDLPVFAPCSGLDPNCRRRGGGEGGNRPDGTGGGTPPKTDDDAAAQAATAALLAQMDRHAKEGPRAVASSGGGSVSGQVVRMTQAAVPPASPRLGTAKQLSAIKKRDPHFDELNELAPIDPNSDQAKILRAAVVEAARRAKSNLEAANRVIEKLRKKKRNLKSITEADIDRLVETITYWDSANQSPKVRVHYGETLDSENVSLDFKRLGTAEPGEDDGMVVASPGLESWLKDTYRPWHNAATVIHEWVHTLVGPGDDDHSEKRNDAIYQIGNALSGPLPPSKFVIPPTP